MDIFDLVAKLSLDSSEYEDGLSDAESKGSGFGKGLATAAKTGVAAIAAVGTAAVAAGTSFVNSASDLASYGDNIDKMSQKLGISAEAYQEWDAVMQHSGTSIETLKAGMKTLNGTLASAGDAINETLAAELALDDQLDSGAITLDEYNEQYEKLYSKAYDSLGPLTELGFSMAEIQEMSQDSDLALEKVITALQGMPEGADRAALAQQLLGRSAIEMGALLNTSAEETQEMRDRVHELGGVMSDDAVKAAAGFQDQLQDMQTAFAGLKRGMMGDFLPSLTEVMGGLTEIFAGNYDEGIEQISAGIEQVVSNLTNIMPQVLQIGVNILESLATSILENLPVLLPTIVDLVLDLGNMIIENLPLLIQAAMQVILQLATGIAEALPELIPTIVDVILQIVDTLINNVDLLIDGAIALMVGLAEGLINALPQLIERIPEIIMKIVNALIEHAPELLSAAVQLIKMLAQGIIQSIPAVLSAIGNLLGQLFTTIAGVFPKMLESGKEMLSNMANGITSFISKVKDAVGNVIKSITDTIKGLIDKAVTWGKDMIQNFIDGIKAKISAVGDAVKGVADKIKGLIGFSEPEDPQSPLHNFHTYAPDMMQLFAQGIKDGKAMLQDTVADAFDFGGMIVGGNASMSAGPVGAVEGAGSGFSAAVIEALKGITIEVMIGQERLDGMVTKAIQRSNYRSGGR